MATLQGMSGMDVRAETAELSALLPLWIGKIYQYDNSSFGFRLNGEEKARYFLFVERGVRAHLTSELPPAPKNPSGFSMYLRKYIEGGKVLAIEQKGIERVLILSIGKGPNEYRLIIEMFDDGNLILTDENFKIINALSQKRFRERDIIGGAMYDAKATSPEDLTYEEFKALMLESVEGNDDSDKKGLDKEPDKKESDKKEPDKKESDKKESVKKESDKKESDKKESNKKEQDRRDTRDIEIDIVRALAKTMMLGGVNAEEICLAAGVSKSMPVRFAEDSQLKPVYDSMVEWIKRVSTPDAVIDAKGAFPLPSATREPKQKFATFSQALDAFYPKPEPVHEVEKEKRLTKEERIRKQQEAAIVSFDKKIAEANEIAEIIYGHYGEVQETIDVLSAASKKMSWQDIESVLKGSALPAAKRVVSINPEKASVVLDVGEKHRVTIFVHESLEANAGRYSQIAKKFRAKKAGAYRAMEAGVKHAEKKKSTSHGKLKPKWYHRFRWMETTDGVTIIGGRNADQNEELIKKYMEGKDTFLHADVFGASVIIIKGHTEKMNEATQFAASYSRLWSGGVASGNVIEASPSQVSKTPESGEYVAHGSFVIRGERKIHKDVPLEVAIGVMTDPVYAVIGGAPAAIEPRTKTSVRLRPGTFEGNDIAKKVLRKLKEAIPENEQKELKAVLNTEAVAAFVPPGGSDIV